MCISCELQYKIDSSFEELFIKNFEMFGPKLQMLLGGIASITFIIQIMKMVLAHDNRMFFDEFLLNIMVLALTGVTLTEDHCGGLYLIFFVN